MSMSRARILLLLCLITMPLPAQIPDGTLHRRISAVSNFEFAIHNNGLLWGDGFGYYRWLAHWPRGSFHMNALSGIAVMAKKGNRLLVSELGLIVQRTDFSHGPFRDFVPGWVGDENAGYDSTFNGAGWRYVDSPDFVVYCSLDHDPLTGVDITGSNLNDWPIRLVDGVPTYVPFPLRRGVHPPAFTSDEDIFCVFKDTEVRADEIYAGPDGPSIPIGIEIQLTIHTWGTGPARDIVVFNYLILNKSHSALDSCRFLFNPDILITGTSQNNLGFRREIGSVAVGTGKPLVYIRASGPGEMPAGWSVSPAPPTIGYALMDSPIGYDGSSIGHAFAGCATMISKWIDSVGQQRGFFYGGQRIGDSLLYRVLTNPGVAPPYETCTTYPSGPAMLSMPFPMSTDHASRFTYAIIFADSLPHLRLLDDLHQTDARQQLPETISATGTATYGQRTQPGSQTHVGYTG